MSEQPEEERAEWLRLWLSHNDGLSSEEADNWKNFATLTREQQRQAIISLMTMVKETSHLAEPARAPANRKTPPE